MNDNQENKNLDEAEDEKQPFTKRIAKASAFIYLGLAIAVVITATVGIFSISYDYEDALSDVSFPEVDFDTDVSIPQIVITPEDIKPDRPVGNEQSGVDADVSTPETRVMYYSPVEGEIIKGYSMDSLVFSQTMGDYRVHAGIDIAAEKGSKVVAYSAGVISSVTDDYFYGTTVAITHDRGVVTYYMNLDPTLAANIAVGCEVLAGQAIGTVGATARIESADQSHLHFEMRVNDVTVNPEKELP